MRTPEIEKKLAGFITRTSALRDGIRGSLERILIPLQEGILPHILSASSGFRHPIRTEPALSYPLHQLVPVRTRIH